MKNDSYFKETTIIDKNIGKLAKGLEHDSIVQDTKQELMFAFKMKKAMLCVF